ncbi:hypothetical protein [Gimesia aquarii]|uniref:Uncharacterized protein n=1 Tax=Gimesia aquarii TaxID=2527964 RepID=A0A517W4P6_9PLAN|nr:hypothetical protein [Gimesia aquarii]QDU00214.1 hypothetical protein V144x_57270 [Gimesia aquarii]
MSGKKKTASTGLLHLYSRALKVGDDYMNNEHLGMNGLALRLTGDSRKRHVLTQFFNEYAVDGNWRERMEQGMPVFLNGWSSNRLTDWCELIIRRCSSRGNIDLVDPIDINGKTEESRRLLKHTAQIEQLLDESKFPQPTGFHYLEDFVTSDEMFALAAKLPGQSQWKTVAARNIRQTLVAIAHHIDATEIVDGKRRFLASGAVSCTVFKQVGEWVSRLYDAGMPVAKLDNSPEGAISTRQIRGLAGYINMHVGLFLSDTHRMRSGLVELLEVSLMAHDIDEGHWYNVLNFIETLNEIKHPLAEEFAKLVFDAAKNSRGVSRLHLGYELDLKKSHLPFICETWGRVYVNRFIRAYQSSKSKILPIVLILLGLSLSAIMGEMQNSTSRTSNGKLASLQINEFENFNRDNLILVKGKL